MHEFQLAPLDIAIVVATLGLVVVVGMLASRGGDRSAQSYFLASGKLPWWLIGTGFVATSVSSEQIVGTIGAAYVHGLEIANWEWFTLPAYTLMIGVFIPVYLRNRVTTVPDFLARRFDRRCADLYSWVMLVAYVLIFMTTVLYGGSLTLSELTGWNFQVVLWTITVLAGLYTVKGGLNSVMWTDAVQCVLLVGGGVILFFVALDRIPGGWGAMLAANPERFHLYQPPGDSMAPFLGLLMGALGVGLFYQSTNQVMIQRVLGARSTWDGLMGIIFAAFINFLRPLVTCLLGLIVYHWIFVLRLAEPLTNPDTAFAMALSAFATGWGIRGIVLAGFLAAVMSTISSLANSTGTIFSLDVYARLWNQTDDRRLVRCGQAASLLSLAAAAAMAPMVEGLGGIFRFFQMGVSYLATPFISVVLLGILWKRTSPAAGLFGIVGGVAIQASVAVGLPALGWSLHWFYLAFIAQVLIMASVVVVSLASAPPREDQWKPFHWRPVLLQRLRDETDRPWFQDWRLWFGLYALIWIALYWTFW